MILQPRQRENSKRGFLKMKIKVLFLLVITILTAAGATINTARIDQLTGLKGKLNEKEGAYKISFTREDIAVSVDGWKMQLSWDSTPGPHLQRPRTMKPWSWVILFYSRTKLILRCS